MHFKNTTAWKCKKSGLRDAKRENFIRYCRRSRLINPDKPKIFLKKYVKNHSYPQFHLVLAKIRMNRGLLYYIGAVCCFVLNTDKKNRCDSYKTRRPCVLPNFSTVAISVGLPVAVNNPVPASQCHGMLLRRRQQQTQ